MKKLFYNLVMVAAVALAGCNDRVDERDTGGVLLELSFQTAPYQVSVNGITTVSLPTVVINSVVATPGGATSAQMDVQVETIEVIYSRADNGTRVPPPFYIQLVGVVPVGGTLSYNNLPIMSGDQLNRVPLSDLKFENGAIDRETGASVVKLTATIRVYGRTVSGRNVSSQSRNETFEFLP